MRTLFKIILICLVFHTSCRIKKDAVKTKTSTEKQNDINRKITKVTEQKREGGNIKTSVLPEEKRERDENGNFKEFVQLLKDGALTKEIHYKSDGTIDIDCTADEIWTRIEERLDERDKSIIKTDTKEKVKSKDESFGNSILIYIALVIGIYASFRKKNRN